MRGSCSFPAPTSLQVLLPANPAAAPAAAAPSPCPPGCCCCCCCCVVLLLCHAQNTFPRCPLPPRLLLLIMLLGPNTVAGSLGVPVMTIGVKR